MSQVGLKLEFTGGADDVSDLDDVDKAYMILVSAVAIADGAIERAEFLLLAHAAWDAAAAPAGTVLQ